MMDKTFLTISSFLSGLRCPKRLYFDVHHPELKYSNRAPEGHLWSNSDLALRLAAHLFPQGLWAGYDPKQTAQGLMSEKAQPIFEAAFQGGSLSVRVEVIVPNLYGSWDLFLVRTGYRINSFYLWSLALAQHVLAEAGVDIRRAGLIHPDPEGCWPSEHQVSPPAELFLKQEDLRDLTVDMIPRLPGLIAEMTKVLFRSQPPRTTAGPQCQGSLPCSYLDICQPPRSKHWVGGFYRMSAERKKNLLAKGLEHIGDIPADEPLTPMQQRIRQAVISGRPYMDQTLARKLMALPKPIYYLDFETTAWQLPFFPGARSGAMVPYQWSLHVEDDRGLRPKSFLASGREDPRPELVRALLAAIGPIGPILTYTHYERQVLRNLKSCVPEFGDELEKLAGRCVDLCAMVRQYLYHPDFGQSFSLKAVLAALAPELSYRFLEVRDGLEAGRVFLNMVFEPDLERRNRLRQALLDYCGRDTLALVVIKRYALGDNLPGG
ncbi:MAG: DUF2779 domain-containing protein [Deltaproteobacteria bacterium]|nr:DUF2779 domain-containing protein [Deltaproteobacteria bacterium]